MTNTQERGIIEMAKYVSLTYERIQNPASKGKFFVRLAYGVVGSYMDTKSMTAREVIEEFLNRNGVKTPKEFFEKKFGKKQEKKQESPVDKEKPKNAKPTKTNKKQELVDFVKQQLKVDLDTSDDETYGKRNILYASIPEHKENSVLDFLHKHGYRTESHTKNRYWIYLR